MVSHPAFQRSRNARGDASRLGSASRRLFVIRRTRRLLPSDRLELPLLDEPRRGLSEPGAATHSGGLAEISLPRDGERRGRADTNRPRPRSVTPPPLLYPDDRRGDASPAALQQSCHRKPLSETA